MGPSMKPRGLGILPLSLCILIWAAGCSHATFNTGGGGGKTAPMFLTFHDTAAAGITVTSFEVTVTGAVLQPGNVSLLSSPQTIELTQLQTNSAFLSTTNVPLGTYTSLMVTYASPQYTFLNNSGVQVTAGGQPCAAGASCVVTSPTVSPLTLTLSAPAFPSVPVTSASIQTLLEVDVNLNNIIQPNFSLNFGPSASGGSGAVTVTQFTGTAGNTAIGNFNVTGQVGSVSTTPTNQFTLTTANGKTLTILAGSTTFEFARANCAANNFTCLAAGQIVGANVDIFSNGSLGATEVDFDDVPGTQQVSGTIVTENNSPPTSFKMIVHNTIPPVAGLTLGTPVTVNIGGTASFVINNGSFVLPTGMTFATTSDLLVGQEVEARVASGTSISNGAFTTDRLALERTQVQSKVTSLSPTAQPPQPSFVLNPLPPLFVNPVTQIQVLTITQGTTVLTTFENLTPLGITGLTQSQPVTVGGFLFNTVGSPTIVATTVRGEVPGT